MRCVLGVTALSVLLTSSPVFGQTPPAGASAQPVQPQPPRPFPEGAKVAYVNVQRIASESAEGKASTTKVQQLNDEKVAELAKRNNALQEAQKKLQQGGTVMSDSARFQLEKDIEKMQVEIQRFTQDAQADVRDLQESLQVDFQKKLIPVIDSVGRERGLHMIFSQLDSGLVWADPGLDITVDVIQKFDAQNPAPAAGAAPPTKN